jgi:hypothetical protein
MCENFQLGVPLHSEGCISCSEPFQERTLRNQENSVAFSPQENYSDRQPPLFGEDSANYLQVEWCRVVIAKARAAINVGTLCYHCLWPVLSYAG